MTLTKTKTRRMARELRESVCGIKTFWDSSADAMNLVEEILRSYGLDVGKQRTYHDCGDRNHRWTYEVVSDTTGDVLDDTVLVWMTYRMPSGRTEVTCCLS